MTDTTKTPSKALSDQKQTLRAQLFAITSQGRVLAASTSVDEQTAIDALLLDVHDLVEGVEDVASELGMLSETEKARRSRAETRLAEDICQRALALKNRQCLIAGNAADGDLHVMTVEQKARVQLSEQALARAVCRLSQGLAVDATDDTDDETLRTMLISYAPNQGILSIAIDTGATEPGCKCQSEARSRQVLTFVMQIEVICRMALDLLRAAG